MDQDSLIKLDYENLVRLSRDGYNDLIRRSFGTVRILVKSDKFGDGHTAVEYFRSGIIGINFAAIPAKNPEKQEYLERWTSFIYTWRDNDVLIRRDNHFAACVPYDYNRWLYYFAGLWFYDDYYAVRAFRSGYVIYDLMVHPFEIRYTDPFYKMGLETRILHEGSKIRVHYIHEGEEE